MWKASDLEGASFAAPRFLIPDLLPEGVTLLSGTPKIGKSWMLLNIGIACSAGGSFLDRPTSKTPVLYLALEDNLRRIQQRLRMVCGWDSFPDALDICIEWNRFPRGLVDLSKVLGDTPYGLVMIDTLEMVRPPRRANSYEDDYRALSGLRALAGEHGIGCLVVHHNRKTETKSDGTLLDPLERVSGTMGLTGCVDSILVLSRTRGLVEGSLTVMGRDVEEQVLNVRLLPSMGTWMLSEKSNVRQD